MSKLKKNDDLFFESIATILESLIEGTLKAVFFSGRGMLLAVIRKNKKKKRSLSMIDFTDSRIRKVYKRTYGIN